MCLDPAHPSLLPGFRRGPVLSTYYHITEKDMSMHVVLNVWGDLFQVVFAPSSPVSSKGHSQLHRCRHSSYLLSSSSLAVSSWVRGGRMLASSQSERLSSGLTSMWVWLAEVSQTGRRTGAQS